jgi:lipopolysaccharide transport system ATP-binding protein
MTLRRDPYAVDVSPNAQGDCLSLPVNSGLSDLVVRSLPNTDQRWGNRQAEILGVKLLDQDGRGVESIYHGDALTLRVSVKFSVGVARPLVGFLMRNRLGEDISGSNTSVEQADLPPALADQIYTVDFHLQLPLLHSGNYYFSVAVANGTHEEYVICDWVENAIMLLLKDRSIVYGYMKFDCRIELKYLGPTVPDLDPVGGRP